MARAASVDLTRVPFVDLAPSHAPIQQRILSDVGALLDSGRFINGPEVARFEQEFAAYCETSQCVGVASGLDGLRLSLIAGGLQPGEAVVVPAFTFVATVEAVVQAGGVPVLAEVREDDFNLDVAAAEAALTPQTRFLMPVHLYGQLADMRALAQLAERRDLRIVEDACQAHGAHRDGVRPGGAALAAAYSFYPGKNLGAIGDAGATVTNDAGLAARIKALREHGQVRKYEHELSGYTARLDTIQAIALLHKLPRLDDANRERAAAAAYYGEHLDGVGDLRLPRQVPDGRHVWHLYVVRTADPDALGAFLAERAIGSGRHYPDAVHMTRAFGDLAREGEFPVSERIAAEVLSLPIFPGIEEAQLEAVVAAVRQYFARR